MADTLNVAFIKARWHADIVDQVLNGFEADMAAAGRKVAISTYDVPGAFEMPLLAKKLGETGRFDAIVTGSTTGGIWVRIFSPPADGKLVRGKTSLKVGDKVRVKLVSTDVERGFIDFATQEN